MVVLDEADRMFELGFEYQMRSIVNNIRLLLALSYPLTLTLTLSLSLSLDLSLYLFLDHLDLIDKCFSLAQQ
jgi:hypothetical protein